MARRKIVKPTLAEARKIKKRLEKQYPQMFKYPAGSRAAVKHLSKADQDIILEKTVAKKMKAIYKKK